MMHQAIAVLAGLALATAVQAAELTLLSGGAVEPGVHAAVHAFEKASGHKVKVTFNTTPQKKPFYLKCCAQSLCAGCLQKVLNKPHRVHRLEFDEDDTLVHQWVVMRRALGLQVPEY